MKRYLEFVKENYLISETYGKGVLATFFKCLTALGFKDNTHQTGEIPAEFLIFFKLSGVDLSKIEGVFKRYTSLSSIQIDYSQPTMGLYFGIRCSGDFEYGYYYDELVPIGTFKLTKSSYNSIKLSESPSSSGLKKALVDLTVADIQLLGKIKNEMEKFNPGYSDKKMAPVVNGRIITFGYYGAGNWNQGKIDEGELLNIKNNLKSFLSKNRWSDKVLVSVVPDKFWVYINIKLK